jgi:hypothetical protein
MILKWHEVHLFSVVLHVKGARHGVYAGAFARKIASPKNPKGTSSDHGQRPVIDHLHIPMVLSSSQSTPGNKKSLRKVRGVPKAPAKDQHLVSNPHEPRGQPSRGSKDASMHKASAGGSPLPRKAKHGRIIEDQGRSDHLAKETQIRRSVPGPSPHEQPSTRWRWSLGSLKHRRFHVREGPGSLNDEEGPVFHHARQFALSCWHR